MSPRPWYLTEGEAVYRALLPYVDDNDRHDATRAAIQALDLDDPAKPAVWSDRPDIAWCVRCDAWHRTDHDHDWRPQDATR